MKSDNSGKILNSIKPSKIILPIIIGLSATAYMLYSEFQPEAFDNFRITYYSIIWLFISFLMMAARDLGYIIRLRILSNNQLSFKKALNIVMLWEFTSAITPSAIGGTSVAIFFLNKEGIRVGRSTAIVMVTSFLDELYFIITFPFVIWLVGRSDIFSFGQDVETVIWYKNQFLLFAWGGYGLKLIYTLILSYGLFFNPRGLKFLLLWIFKLPIIRKWRPQANESGSELIQTSKEFRQWPFKNWLKALAATAFSWTSRYWVVNTLIVCFFGTFFIPFTDHLLIFGKQLIMWVMMLISPTPGGSGFAEYVFKEFLASLIPEGTGTSLAFFWRLISYYPYLIIGAFIVPRWIKKHFFKAK